MQRLELTSEQCDILRETVKHAVADLVVEVFRTDRNDFKEMLKHRLMVLEQIARILEVPVTAEPLSV